MLGNYVVTVSLGVCALLLYNSCVEAVTIAELRETVKPLRSGCARHVGGVDQALLEGIEKGQFPPDHQLQCYLRCVLIYLRTWKDGKPVPSVFVAQVKNMPRGMQDRILKASKVCYDNMVYDADECVTVWNQVKCNYEQDPEVFFFP